MSMAAPIALSLDLACDIMPLAPQVNTIIDEQERGAGPQLGTTGPWWRRGLVAVGRVIQGQRQRRPSWRGSIG